MKKFKIKAVQKEIYKIGGKYQIVSLRSQSTKKLPFQYRFSILNSSLLKYKMARKFQNEGENNDHHSNCFLISFYIKLAQSLMKPVSQNGGLAKIFTKTIDDKLTCFQTTVIQIRQEDFSYSSLTLYIQFLAGLPRRNLVYGACRSAQTAHKLV